MYSHCRRSSACHVGQVRGRTATITPYLLQVYLFVMYAGQRILLSSVSHGTTLCSICFIDVSFVTCLRKCQPCRDKITLSDSDNNDNHEAVHSKFDTVVPLK